MFSLAVSVLSFIAFGIALIVLGAKATPVGAA